MRTVKNGKVIAGWHTTKRTVIVLSAIFTSTAAEQPVVLSRLSRPADLLYVPGGEEHFTSSETPSLEIGEANRLL